MVLIRWMKAPLSLCLVAPLNHFEDELDDEENQIKVQSMVAGSAKHKRKKENKTFTKTEVKPLPRKINLLDTAE